MIDAPGREKPRFPPDKEPVAAQAIAGALADLHVGPDDLCICGGACGGDLLFAEAALARSRPLEIYIPFEEPTFLEKSVDFANNDWRARFFAAKARSALHVAPRELGPLQEGEDPYERNNRWMLEAALRFGAGQGRFRLPVERRGRRRAGRRAAHDGGGSQARRTQQSGSTRGSCGVSSRHLHPVLSTLPKPRVAFGLKRLRGERLERQFIAENQKLG